MSDARNSSSNIRGGGARQTGGSGRTQKNTSSTPTTNNNDPFKTNTLDKKALLKLNLQLRTMSKRLALLARTTMLEHHTEEEYAGMNVPLPDPETALVKLRAMAKFTEEWHDAAFRERWLGDVLEVWNRELKESYEKAVRAAEERRGVRGDGNGEGVAVSIGELEAMLRDVDLSVEERAKLKKKLKKRKQKEKKKNTGLD